MIALKFIENNAKEKYIRLDKTPVSVGNCLDSDIRLHTLSKKKFSFMIIKKKHSYFLKTNYKNIFLNQEEIKDSPINHLDCITINHLKFTFFSPQETSDYILKAKSLLEDSNYNDYLNKMFLSENISFEKKFSFKKNSIDLSHFTSKQKSLRYYSVLQKILLSNEQTLDSYFTLLVKNLKTLFPGLDSFFYLSLNQEEKSLYPVYFNCFLKSKRKNIIYKKILDECVNNNLYIYFENGLFENKNFLYIPFFEKDNSISFVVCKFSKKQSDLKIKNIVSFLMSTRSKSFEIIDQQFQNFALVDIIKPVISIVEMKDQYTFGHSERVSQYCLIIAEELGLDAKTKELLSISALMHDIGKINISDKILKKKSKLTASEFAIMKTHPELGANILKSMPQAKKITPGIRHHHEKWDGSGYPDALKKEDIPFFSRIIALADSYDAIISSRPYIGDITKDQALKILKKESFLYDPQIFEAFLRACKKNKL